MAQKALIVETESPLDNKLMVGQGTKGTVRILVETGSDPIYASRGLKLDPKHWLVAGMEVPLEIDPDKPDEFEIDWDRVPSIEDRVKANDPTLTDPIGTRRKVLEAMRSAGLAGPEAPSPGRFEEALERAGQESAPAGKQRAVVLVATTTATLSQNEHGAGSDHRRETSGKRKAVLSVNVPGREPYAVLAPKFNRPEGTAELTGAGLPAVVSTSDPNDVEVLWDELPGLGDQLGQRMADSMQASQAQSAGLEEQVKAAQQQAISAGPGAAPPGAGALGGDMQNMLAQQAKQALSMVKDPAQRKMLIEQYKRAGIDVSEFEEDA